MYYLQCTKKLLDRVKPELFPPGKSDTRLGNWYATAKFWKPQIALLVSESIFLPVLMPLAPAATLAKRFPKQLAGVLHAHRVNAEFIAQELWRMAEVRHAKTSSRSIVAVLSELSRCADFSLEPDGYEAGDKDDLLALSVRLAHTPLSPLFRGAISPDRALRELVQG